MAFQAHTPPENSKKWHPLKSHLFKEAKLAREFGNKFNAGEKEFKLIKDDSIPVVIPYNDIANKLISKIKNIGLQKNDAKGKNNSLSNYSHLSLVCLNGHTTKLKFKTNFMK